MIYASVICISVFSIHRVSQRNVPIEKNPKLNTIGPNFTKYITWEVLFRLSLLVRNYQKLISRHKGFRLLVIESVHCFLGGTP